MDHPTSLVDRDLPFVGGPHAAPAHDRALAFAVDVFLVAASAPFTLGLCAIVLRPLWPVGALALALLYAFACYRAGQSPGMRLIGMRLVDHASGKGVFRAQAALRALFVVAPPAAALALASAQVPGPSAAASDPIPALELWAAAGVVAAGVFDHLWMMGDGARRPLHDALTNVSLVLEQRTQHH